MRWDEQEEKALALHLVDHDFIMLEMILPLGDNSQQKWNHDEHHCNYINCYLVHKCVPTSKLEYWGRSQKRWLIVVDPQKGREKTCHVCPITTGTPLTQEAVTSWTQTGGSDHSEEGYKWPGSGHRPWQPGGDTLNLQTEGPSMCVAQAMKKCVLSGSEGPRAFLG